MDTSSGHPRSPHPADRQAAGVRDRAPCPAPGGRAPAARRRPLRLGSDRGLGRAARQAAALAPRPRPAAGGSTPRRSATRRRGRAHGRRPRRGRRPALRLASARHGGAGAASGAGARARTLRRRARRGGGRRDRPRRGGRAGRHKAAYEPLPAIADQEAASGAGRAAAAWRGAGQPRLPVPPRRRATSAARFSECRDRRAPAPGQQPRHRRTAWKAGRSCPITTAKRAS